MRTPANRPLRYHLRFQILPGRNVERDARILAAFCRAHGIEEVVLFYAAEEWNNGLLSRAEEDRWFETVRRAKRILEAAGLVCSLNPWATVLHGDYGRRFPRDRAFRPMVSPLGERSRACASFADPVWQKYIRDQYARFARLGFRVIWVEDDFRYHNHKPLTWGGGFEPEVLARFAAKVGRKVTRREVIANILRPGRPHHWRRLWLATWRELQLEAAEGLARAVSVNTPTRTKLGLMSSIPSTHSVEGRDWQRLFAALSIAGEVAHRPSIYGSDDYLGKEMGHAILMLGQQRSLRPAGCEVAPEIENYPFTNWAKSDSLTWAQMALCLFFGSDALLLDLFPFAANPANREPGIGRMLDLSRPALEWIVRRFSPPLPTHGVGLPWRQDVAERVWTAEGKSLAELDVSSFPAGQLLLRYGVPVCHEMREVNALFGPLAWAFDDTELRAMLSNGLMLDATAAEVLCRRGYGRDIGITFCGWLSRWEHNYALEEVLAGCHGAPVGHLLNINKSPRLAVLRPRSGASVWTRVITPERKTVGAGMVAFRNHRSGRVIVHALPDPARNASASYHRQALLHRAVRFLAKRHFDAPLVTGGPYLMPIQFAAGDRGVLVVFNGSPDAASPQVMIPRPPARGVRAHLLRPLAAPRPVKMHGNRCRWTTQSADVVPYLGYLVLEW